MLNDYLKQVGLNEKERTLYLSLAEMGIQPASVIAKKCNFDRVTAYKNLKKLADKGFVKTYYRDNIQCFGIESFENIKVHLSEKMGNIEELLEKFPIAQNLLKSAKADEQLIPKLEIFEGEPGLKKFFKDILYELKKEKIKQIRMLTSNTFNEKLGNVALSEFVQNFFQEIKNKKIDLEIFEACGTLMPERVQKVSPKEFDPALLPAARGTTSIFLVGHAVYIACYKNTQIGLKIKQSDMSQIFHFIFDFLQK
ncbi:hypothetical protein GF354_02740 [Candidatus Peregrinibacteria bacterium]|nr:hypothetical protein [Candidatus Peregrinibacteria bacterium]